MISCRCVASRCIAAHRAPGRRRCGRAEPRRDAGAAAHPPACAPPAYSLRARRPREEGVARATRGGPLGRGRASRATWQPASPGRSKSLAAVAAGAPDAAPSPGSTQSSPSAPPCGRAGGGMPQPPARLPARRSPGSQLQSWVPRSFSDCCCARSLPPRAKPEGKSHAVLSGATSRNELLSRAIHDSPLPAHSSQPAALRAPSAGAAL